MYTILLGLKPPLCLTATLARKRLWAPALICVVRVVSYLLASLALAAFGPDQSRPAERVSVSLCTVAPLLDIVIHGVGYVLCVASYG